MLVLQSLLEARLSLSVQGGRHEASGLITSTTGIGVTPIHINIQTILPGVLRNGDISNYLWVQGNIVCNNLWKIFNVTTTSFEINAQGSGNYAGGGQWFRAEDNGYPNILEYHMYYSRQ